MKRGRKLGSKMPNTKTDRFELRTTEGDAQEIKKLATNLNVSASEAVRLAVKFALKNNMKKES